jgi:hypothetical protein
MDSQAIEYAVYYMIRNIFIAAVILIAAAFLIGRCSAGHTVKSEPAKEASNG